MLEFEGTGIALDVGAAEVGDTQLDFDGGAETEVGGFAGVKVAVELHVRICRLLRQRRGTTDEDKQITIGEELEIAALERQACIEWDEKVA